jgi:tuftelin-interacting protein 11
MARRKRVLDDGDDSDSPGSEDDRDFDLENDPDAREERALFENPYQNKRRKKNGKEDALYGIFAESSEDEGTNGRTSKVGSKRSDWAKAPTFTSSDKPVKLDDPMPVDDDDQQKDDDASGEDSEDDAGEDEEVEAEDEVEEQSNNSESSRAPSPPVRVGLAFGNKQGIGQKFTRESNPSPRPVPLPASELAHFSKIQGSFGARMLAKMGWQAGTGLGVTGEGIVTPIESKLRPQKMGIAFKGFKEKTEQSKMEAKRRGEALSADEDEDTKKFRRKAKEQAEKRSEVWKRPKKAKVKIEHKTYEQIIAEAEEVATPGIGQIIDATGAVVRVFFWPSYFETYIRFEPREVASLADISLNAWSPSNDPTRIPEVRHNVRLIADACKSDLDGLAREAKTLQERNKFATVEDLRLRKKVDDEAQRKLFLSFIKFQVTDSVFVVIARLQQVQLLTNDINTTAKELTSVYEVSLELFSPHFQKLISEYSYEYDKYRLDEIVVAAIAPVIRLLVANWNPLEQPSSFLSTFRLWQRALKINDVKIPSRTQVDVYGTQTTVTPAITM